jgi:hypothetical protein
MAMEKMNKQDLNLLDKIYNYRDSENSRIVTDIEADIESISNDLNRNKQERDREIEEINALNAALEAFKKSSQEFVSKFSSFSNDQFEPLAIAFDINIPFESYVDKVKDNKDSYIENESQKIERSETKLSEMNAEVDRISEILQNTKDKLDSSKENAKRLDDLIIDVLANGSDAYNRSYIRRIIDGLETFTYEEATRLEYLFLFPEDGLKKYESNYKDGQNRDEVEVEEPVVEETPVVEEEVEETPVVEEPVIETPSVPFAPETPEFTPEEEPVTEEPVAEEPEDEEEIESEFTPEDEESADLDLTSLNQNDVASFNPFEEQEQPLMESEEEPNLEESSEEETVEEEVEETPVDEEEVEEETTEEESEVEEEATEPEVQEEPIKLNDDIDKFLDSISIDASKFSPEALEELKKTPESIIASNYGYLKRLSVNNDVIYNVHNGYMYLTDKDFVKKIESLNSVGVKNIYIADLLNDYGITCPYEELRDRIRLLKSKENVTDENLFKLNYDLATYYNNLDYLTELNIEPDTNELLICLPELSTIDARENIEVLKDYVISIIKRSNKYSFEMLWKTPKELAYTIDNYLESNLTKLIEANPEVLGFNSDQIIKRINYCNKNNIPLMDENKQGSYADYIIDITNTEPFKDSFEELPENNNDKLPALVGDEEFTKKILGYLDDYNNGEELNVEISDAGVTATVEDLRIRAGQMFNDDDSDNRTYNISNIYISRPKMTRNISYIMQKLYQNDEMQDTLKYQNKIILMSALYNLRLTEDKIAEIVEFANQNIGEE